MFLRSLTHSFWLALRFVSNLLSLIALAASNHVSLKSQALLKIWDEANNFRNLSFSDCKWIAFAFFYRLRESFGQVIAKAIKNDFANDKLRRRALPSRLKGDSNMRTISLHKILCSGFYSAWNVAARWEIRILNICVLQHEGDKKLPKVCRNFGREFFTLKSVREREKKLIFGSGENFFYCSSSRLKNAFCFHFSGARNL